MPLKYMLTWTERPQGSPMELLEMIVEADTSYVEVCIAKSGVKGCRRSTGSKQRRCRLVIVLLDKLT